MAKSSHDFVLVLAQQYSGMPEFIVEAIKEEPNFRDVEKRGHEVLINVTWEEYQLEYAIKNAVKRSMALGFPVARVELEPRTLGLTFSAEDFQKANRKSNDLFSAWKEKQPKAS